MLISHGCWDEGSGEVEDFMRWRALLARVAGIGTEMADIGGVAREIPRLPYEELEIENTLGVWADKPKDPLILLLAHSDEEGSMSWQHADALADRLEELLPAHAVASHHAPGSVLQQAETARTTQFIAGLRKAVAATEDVNFGQE